MPRKTILCSKTLFLCLKKNKNKKSPQTSWQLQMVRNKLATTLFPSSLCPVPAAPRPNPELPSDPSSHWLDQKKGIQNSKWGYVLNRLLILSDVPFARQRKCCFSQPKEPACHLPLSVPSATSLLLEAPSYPHPHLQVGWLPSLALSWRGGGKYIKRDPRRPEKGIPSLWTGNKSH